MKKKFGVIGALIAFVALIAVAFIFANGLLYYSYVAGNATVKDAEIFIPTGATADDQVDILLANGVINDSSMYRNLTDKFKYSRIYPGRYIIKSGLTYKELLSIIGRGNQQPVKVTFNNIRTADKLAGVVSKYIEADSLSLINAFNNSGIIDSVGLKRETFLSLFIPNTYEFYWNCSAEEFVGRMKKEYDRFWSQDSREEKLSELGMTKEEVSILASIIIEESKHAPEMPLIASVYLNRLKIGMPLQADPTVKFALGDPTIKRVLLRHLDVESPYNTYKNGGLPPGVICVPPIVAIDAVLNSEKSDYLYFCADSGLTGKHVFAKTLSQHNVNAKKYASELNRRGIR